jgi:hypothetical protein
VKIASCRTRLGGLSGSAKRGLSQAESGLGLAHGAAKLRDPILLLLDLLSPLLLLDELLNQLLLVYVMNVLPTHVILLLISLPQKSEFLLGLSVFPEHRLKMIDLLSPLLKAFVVVFNHLLLPVFEVLKVNGHAARALIVEFLERIEPQLVFLGLLLDRFA